MSTILNQPGSPADIQVMRAMGFGIHGNGLQDSPRFMSPTLLSTSKQTPTFRKAGKENLIALAVKRVGLRRVKNSTPLLRKDSTRLNNNVTLSNKYTATYAEPVSIPKEKERGSPSSKASSDLNKPLPSTPAAQVETSGVTDNSRYLLDASEQPFKRSPPGKLEEEWPALPPERLTFPTSLVEVFKNEEQKFDVAAERHPENSSAGDSKSLDQDYKTVVHPIRRKIVSEKLNESKSSAGQDQLRASTSNSTMWNPFNDAPVSKHNRIRTNKPRQTRTSSLRAELAAASAASIPQGNGNAVSSKTDWAYQPPLSKTSRGSLHKPAKVVAGRRLPAPKRPDSLGSHGNMDQISHKAPLAPLNHNSRTSFDDTSEAKSRRRSSLPVYSARLSQSVRRTRDDRTPSHSTKSTMSVFEDAVSTLDIIPGSPAQDYQTKRLSITSSNHGPILRISRSAEGIIMGTEPDKENDVPTKRDKCNDIHLRMKAAKPAHSFLGTGDVSTMKSFNTTTEHQKPKISIARSMGVNWLPDKDSTDSPPFESTPVAGSCVLEDPFIDQPSEMTAKVTGAHTTIDLSRLTIDEQHIDVGTGTGDESVALEAEGSNSSDKEWISPVARTACAMSLGHPKPILEDYPLVARAEEGDIAKHISSESVTVASIEGLKLSAACNSTKLLKLPENLDTSKVQISDGPPVTPTPARASTTDTSKFPPRSSSRAAASVLDYLDLKRPELRAPIQIKVLSQDSVKTDETTNAPEQGDSVNVGTRKRRAGRESTTFESVKSYGSLSKKGVMTNIRGLFYKRPKAAEAESAHFSKSNEGGKKKTTKGTGTHLPSKLNEHLAHRPNASSSVEARTRSAIPRISQVSTFSDTSPTPLQVSSSTTLAMQILESARHERSSPKKEKLLELGKIMVDAITQVRDAERAVEEAKHAARKAELAHAQCIKIAGEVTRCVVTLRNELLACRLDK